MSNLAVVYLQGVFVKIGDFIKLKGFLVEFLEKETPQSKNTENADSKTRKVRMIGFNVTGFR